jgi:hypothetical protein
MFFPTLPPGLTAFTVIVEKCSDRVRKLAPKGWVGRRGAEVHLLVRNVADLIDSARVRVENKKLSSGTTGREWYIYHALRVECVRSVSGHQQSTAATFVKPQQPLAPIIPPPLPLAGAGMRITQEETFHFIFFSFSFRSFQNKEKGHYWQMYYCNVMRVRSC